VASPTVSLSIWAEAEGSNPTAGIDINPANKRKTIINDHPDTCSVFRFILSPPYDAYVQAVSDIHPSKYPFKKGFFNIYGIYPER